MCRPSALSTPGDPTGHQPATDRHLRRHATKGGLGGFLFDPADLEEDGSRLDVWRANSP